MSKNGRKATHQAAWHNKKRTGDVHHTRSKGRLLEEIAALLYGDATLTVEKNVRLPPVHGGADQPEIDVLLTGILAGYPVRFAVECKNEGAVVERERIDAFVGKLQYVGIPPSHGIFISPTGFRASAIHRAKEVGIRTLIAEGLTSNRLARRLTEATQCVVFYVADVSRIEWTTPGIHGGDPAGRQFYDAEGGHAGTPLDYLWAIWQRDQSVPLVLGEYEVAPSLPDGLHVQKDGKRYPVSSVSGALKVTARVMSLPGKASRLVLSNAEDQSLDRARVDVHYSSPEGKHQLRYIETEAELQECLGVQQGLTARVNVRVPRITYNRWLWPFPRRTFAFLAERLQAGNIQQAGGIAAFDGDAIEGSNLNSAFEPLELAPEQAAVLGSVTRLETQVLVDLEVLVGSCASVDATPGNGGGEGTAEHACEAPKS
jgi:hypothetical protein